MPVSPKGFFRSFGAFFALVGAVFGGLAAPLAFALALALTGPAQAACSSSGSTETCTGDANGGSAIFGAPPVNTLDVNALTQNLGSVALTGVGSSPGSGTSSHYLCEDSGGNPSTDCTIVSGASQTPPVADTCSVNSGAPSGTQCVHSGAAGGGPSGNSGPAVTVIVNSGANTITPGASAPNGVSAGVQGVSNGSRGGNGGNAYVFGGAGDGGAGANGGLVNVTVNGQVNVTGNNVSGVVAVSQAGDGGTGGDAYVIGGSAGNGGPGGFGGDATAQLSKGSVATNGNNAVGVGAFALGGQGGAGGSGGGLFYSSGGSQNAGQGGTATVYTGTGTSIVTYGDEAYGVQARSIGGGGGGGGGGFGLFYSGGGNGSTGGNGGAVTVITGEIIPSIGNLGVSSIVTNGNYAHGILAQSIGGGGGSAGVSIGLVSLGGAGSAGGDGSTVSVTNGSNITTCGTGSGRNATCVGANAIEAQSVGAGGGNSDVSGGLVAVGGDAGAGGSANTVTVGSTDAILTTHGDDSNGILAQSIGGGGGTGGLGGGLVGIGGSGAKGGNGGQVTVSLTATSIYTYGDRSVGILAQSIGGGGGDGGTAGGLVAIGGSGNTASFSNIVTVTTDLGSLIQTAGANSNGIIVQSIGGGGGNGGGAGGLATVGGSGGPGGDGNNVTVDNGATIKTGGDYSSGVTAQSIGGGGGNGGFSLSIAGPFGIGGSGGVAGKGQTVTVDNSGSITTRGAQSPGILAQSVGGGGGNGGGSVSVGAFGAIAIGGTGGAGGAGGTVCVNANGSCNALGSIAASTITTTGDHSNGITAQSIGGGGGNGGYAVAASVGIFGSAALSIGGSGGAGGVGGEVFAGANGDILTHGAGSYGILAQSIGGGGGDGGFSIAATAGLNYASVGLSFGGSGGHGSDAGTVTVDSTANITTTGNLASAIVAQSIGGGGGNGGYSIAAAAAVGASVTLDVSGSGGDGADGKAVNVTSVGNITTGVQNSAISQGAGSNGILAQSIGGGGGNGGWAISGGGAAYGAVNLSFASSGGTGGQGGDVTVNDNNAATQANQIITYANNSDGILAQSVGGKGGNGGFSVAAGGAGYGAVSLAFGGGGGVGSNSNTVDVTSYGAITTYGDRSDGISAQSIGGEGGNGGFAVGAAGGGYGALSLAMGGAGAAGADSGVVTVNSTGAVTTNGSNSFGILAQSIGGGGGDGGFSVGAAGAGYGAVSLSFGGAAGNGGNAFESGGSTATLVASVTSHGNVSTSLAQSTAIMAQAIGGGGGNGGFAGAAGGAYYGAVNLSFGGKAGNGGSAGSVSIDSTGALTTSGTGSNGAFAQSVGGGGGNGGFAVAGGGAYYGAASLTFGGSGGNAGNAGDASVTSHGAVTIFGSQSNGLFAQSIGGGGGNGGFAISASGADNGALNIAMGGGSGNGGSSGKASVDSTGTIITGFDFSATGAGSQSNGIVAQSIGGGGGNGGFAIAAGATFDSEGGSPTFAIGGAGGAGGSSLGGAHVGSTGNIWTYGDSSDGILAQSIGGGGGNGGFSGALALGAGLAYSSSVGGAGGSAGNGAAVDVTSIGNIITAGANSAGIQAESIGGGGGNGAFALSLAATMDYNSVGKANGGSGGAAGAAGAVTVVSNGTVYTGGANSVGISAQSIGGGGGNGGFAIAASLSWDSSAATEANSVGGVGLSGSNGAQVDVTASATSGSIVPGFSVITKGDNSAGIFAQSIGGGGGKGGMSIAGSLNAGGDANGNAVGGVGGGGGNSLNVGTYGTAGYVAAAQVDNTGDIMTSGRNSSAIQAQSIGGGGGDGGFAIGVAGSFNDDSTSKLQSVGGSGGSAGNAGDVIVNNNATAFSQTLIITAQDLSYGILAQSVGGGGGNGGFAIAGSLSTSGGAAADATGGAGAGGGNAGLVMVTSGGAIITGAVINGSGQVVASGGGQGAIGILAQSVGGGGGNGGFAGGLSLGLSGDSATNTTGGSGGRAGNGGIVGVTTLAGALVTTYGDNADGILAQSVGGGGGNGGFSIGAGFSNSEGKSAVNAIGGASGAGGTAGDVTLTNAATVTTYGYLSDGVVAQSIGGGGGNGGFAVSGALSLGDDASSNTTGGSGGAGGDAGVVKVFNTGVIQVNQMGTIGILAQSVGGGGGNGGFAGGVSFSNSGDVNNKVGAGAGGAAGAGKEVDVTNSAAITANGAQGVGILAQSVGGGGGNGGFAITGGVSSSASSETQSVGGDGGGAGSGGAVTVTNNVGGAITTNGAMAYGVIAQSIGGSGGNGGFSIGGSIALGGDAKSTVGGGAGAGGGAAGVVTVDNYDKIVTNGVQSTGVVAQSVGGGGGSGGFAGGLSFSSSGEINNTIGGGSGGAGSTPSNVTVTNHAGAIISTNADNSIGILAQAVGGGGGQGGFSISAGVSGGGGMSQSIGGNGGVGGSAAGTTVTVNNDGQITTNGANSIGIMAQSVGGGGGVGGVSVAGVMDSSGGAKASVGGSAGGGGGAAGDVVVTNTGIISVNGAGSVGVFAQSVGGGGGAAGFAGAFNFTGGGTLSNTVGGGGNGGAGGNVTVKSTGSILTKGQDSVGVLAQSIGGGGGSSIFSIAQQTNSLTEDYMSIGGGGAGTQGANGVVKIEVSGGTTSTVGDLSYGLLAQAIGAGGGAAALSVPDPLTIGAGGNVTALGAIGSISGNGNPLNSQNSNSTVTTGVAAIGLVAQTIGGGGGSGGVTGDVDFTAPGPISIKAGGSTTGGGSGGLLQFANTGASITTGGGAAVASGDAAVGLLAQTIGGGGGVGIDAFGAVTGSAGLVSLDLGGSEGASVNPDAGGQLVLSSGGDVTTSGRFASGFVGQTIGGGGGFAAVTAASGMSASGVQFQLGSMGGAGGDADPTQSSTWTLTAGVIATSGKLSDGAVAQAIGGGGGLAGFVSDGAQNPTLTGVALGASAAGGAGSIVTVNSQSAISTTGIGAIGLIAQSIGGGGGVAQAYGVSGSGPVTIGASGAASGSGAAVNVTSQAEIVTTGTYAHGLVAQSIGGGGGLFQAFDSSGTPLSLSVNAGGGAGGNGGDVNVQSMAAIATSGLGAHGIVAQSIAGGGGLVGGGVFATSLSAAGSFAGSAGGAGVAGTVTVNAQANVMAAGVDASAIVAQSAGATGLGGAIGVTLGNSTLGTAQFVSGGAGAGNAVTILGGAANALVSYATLTTQSGIGGMTVTGGLGGEAVTNYGHLIGSVNLGAGANSLDNKPYQSALNPTAFSGIYDSGPTIYLGAGNLLTNEGLLSVGGLLNVATSNLTGNFLQTASGSCGGYGAPTSTCGYFGVDVDFTNQTADRLNATGTAVLGGAVFVNILNAALALPGQHDVTLISAAGGATDAGAQLQAYQTAVATYSLIQPDPNDIDLRYKVDYSPQGLTENQHSVGYAVNAIQTARISPAFAPIAAALFYQPNVSQLGMVYDSLSGEGVAASEQAAFASTDRFQSAMMREIEFWLSGREGYDSNARVLGESFMSDAGQGAADRPSYASVNPASPYAVPRSWRAWAMAYGGTSSDSGNATVGSAASTENGAGYAMGVDYQIGPSALVGLAGSYSKSGFSVPDRWTYGSVEGGHIAAYGAFREGPIYLAASFGGDFFNNNEVRTASIPGTTLPSLFGTPIVAIPGFAEQPTGSFNSYAWSGQFETGYRSRIGDVDVTPYVGMQFSILQMNGFTETSLGMPSMIGLNYQARSVVTAPTFLGVQLARTFDLGYGMSVDGWVKAAWKHELDPVRSTDAAFISAPGFDFVINGAAAVTDMARIDAGARLKVTRNLEVFGVFQGDFAPTGRSVAGSGGVRVVW